MAPSRLLFVLFLSSLSSFACSKPKAGVGCDESGLRVCVDGKTSLYCDKGKWALDTCKGPKGCLEVGKTATCDVTGNAEGDPCPVAFEGFMSCATDRKTRLACTSGKYATEHCKGEHGCTVEQGALVTCDQGPPAVGTVCKLEKLQACTADKRSFLECRGGKFALAQNCPGEKGCTSEGGGLVACDWFGGAFSAGEPCLLIERVCTADRKGELLCVKGKLVAGKTCPGPDQCTLTGCDDGLAKENEPCSAEKLGRTMCSHDKKNLLACRSTKTDPFVWVVDKKCKSCEPKDGKLECL